MTLPPVTGIPDFWPRVRAAKHLLLGLDYDGTLAPFHVIRDAAVPVPGVLDTLHAIQDETNTEVILLSGRPAAEIRTLLGKNTSFPIIGAHGFEVLTAEGNPEIYTPTEIQRQGLSKAWDLAVTAGHEEHLENKVASLALHIREVPGAADVEAAVDALWRPLTDEHELDLMRFNGGLEIRARGRNKGIAFAAFYANMPLETLPVYIGDDTTDEDVFRFIKPLGLGIRVGDESVETEAAGRLADPAAVQTLLESWRQSLAPPDKLNGES